MLDNLDHFALSSMTRAGFPGPAIRKVGSTGYMAEATAVQAIHATRGSRPSWHNPNRVLSEAFDDEVALSGPVAFSFSGDTQLAASEC
jgi:hypothetical protein